ncbi:MAG: rodA [Chlamydiales bacterium]|jgi:rod shape determining protein RodA|nr:rodA [Chlamydiales bacterium]
MWNYYYLKRIDFRVIPLILALMCISVLVISSNTTSSYLEASSETFFTPAVIKQCKFFGVGWVVFLFFASIDYNKLRDWAWILYTIALIALIGLFFTPAIKDVHRWYKLPFTDFSIQPSDLSKLIVIITLSWFLEKHRSNIYQVSTTLIAGLIIFIPFLLILKQPDLGTALIFYPVTLAMFYFGEANRTILRILNLIAVVGLSLILLIFLDIVPYETIKPYATLVLKEYQFKRLNPHTYHQQHAVIAIAIGGITGSGWNKGEYTARGWLPEPYTDSVFPAFGEEFGLLGLSFLLALFYTLIYCSFQVIAATPDYFARLVAAGITVYLATHIIVNIGMMSGLLPITGFPLILISYGGSSVVSTMAALGVLQSIYSRRFMF